MATEEVLSIARNFYEAASAELPVSGLWLYGSWARGEQDEYSDIDLALTLSEAPTDFLEAEKRLYRIRRKIDLIIEPVIIELEHDGSGFAERVMREGRKIGLPQEKRQAH